MVRGTPEEQCRKRYYKELLDGREPAPPRTDVNRAILEEVRAEVQKGKKSIGDASRRGVDKIAADFNASQSDYKIVPTYKGNYTETMTAAVAAFRAGEQPHRWAPKSRKELRT